MVKINFSNKFAYTIIALSVLVLVAFGINAYSTNPDSGNPSVMGHSRGELNLSPIFINPTNDFVGINQPSPLFQLDVNGSARISGPLSLPGLSDSNCYLAANASKQIVCGADPSGGGITSTGTSNYISKFTTQTSIANSVIYENGGSLGIRTQSVPHDGVHVSGAVSSTNWIGAGCEANCDIGGSYSILYPDGNILTSSNITLGGVIKPISGDVIIQLGP